jgi:geranylgeranyl pyrophosphate synthase
MTSASHDDALAERDHADELPPLLAALQHLKLGPMGRCLDDALPFELWHRALLAPAEELLRRPGKGFRGRLCELAWRGAGGVGAVPRELPWVVELLHVGSLIVDDVQDDSSHRRGGVALHRLVGMPLAINTGNWLYFASLSLIEEAPVAESIRAALTREAVHALMRCHHGQALDLAIHIGSLEPRYLPAVVEATTRHKTGVLMGLAARLGALAAGASAPRVAALARFGEELGVGLQMLDDLGSISARDRRDKGAEDLRSGRPTWPWAWLAGAVDELAVARLQHRVRALGASPATAICAVEPEATRELDAVMNELRDATEAIGRVAVGTQLRRCMSEVAPHLAPAVHRELLDELARLEASYG